MEEVTVVYLNQEETKESKCGDVLRSILGKYSLLCSHCYRSFLCLTEFSQHIEEHYQLIGITTTDELSDTLQTDGLKDENLIKNENQEELRHAATDNLQDVNLIKYKTIERRKIVNNHSQMVKKTTRKKGIRGDEKIIRIKTITTDENLKTEIRKIVNNDSQPEEKKRKKQKDHGFRKVRRINTMGPVECRIKEWFCDICKKGTLK